MNKLIPLSFVLLAAGLALPAQAALKVFACEPEWAALTTELGGRDGEVYSATTARQDVHKIQPRPSLIAKARTCLPREDLLGLVMKAGSEVAGPPRVVLAHELLQGDPAASGQGMSFG